MFGCLSRRLQKSRISDQWFAFPSSHTIKCRQFQSIASPEPFKILFFGRDEFSCLVLEQLYAAQDVWQGIWIVTRPDEKKGRRGTVAPLKLLGQSHDLPVHIIPHSKADFKHWQPPLPFTYSDPSHLLLTASFGRILHPSLLDLFAPSRKLNVHPSLLPMYRGPAPIQRTLLDGRKETGVCVIEMMQRSKGIDAGEIWGMRCLSVPEDASFPMLRDSLAREGGQLVVSVLRDMLAGKAISSPQESSGSVDTCHAPVITFEDARVDFTTMTATEIVRIHRAISHQRPLVAYLSTYQTLQLHSPSIATISSVKIPNVPGTAYFHPPSRSLLVKCAEDTILSVPKMRQQNRALMEAKEWWNGVRPDMLLADGAVRFLKLEEVVRKVQEIRRDGMEG